MNLVQRREAADLIDLERYPVGDSGSPEFWGFVGECRKRLAKDGVILMPGFTTGDATRVLRDEAVALLPGAYYCDIRHNCYLQPSDPSFPPDHPRNRTHRNNKGGIANDLIPGSALLRRIYDWKPLRDFLAAVLGLDALYPLADPLSSLNINVHRTGQIQGWHFDGARFAVTLMLQAAEAGGRFEYVLNLRSDEDPNYAGVARVLDGDRAHVRSIDIDDGMLIVFRGHHSLHQVTAPEGGRLRINAIFSYAAQPGVMLHEHTRRLFYGRVL